MAMNICIFEGTVCGAGAAPKYFPGDGNGNGKKSVITFSVAVQRAYKNSNGDYECDFVSCKAFAATADFINSHFKEKDHIGIQGSYMLEKFQNQQTGVEQTYPKFVIDRAYFVGTKTNDNNMNNSTPQTGYGMQQQFPQQQGQFPQQFPGQQQGQFPQQQQAAQAGYAPQQPAAVQAGYPQYAQQPQQGQFPGQQAQQQGQFVQQPLQGNGFTLPF